MGWLLRSLGIGDEIASRLGDANWAWARPVWLWIGLVLLVPVGWFIVSRHRRRLAHVSPRARRALGACRIGVLLLLVVVLGGPYLRLEERLEHKPVLALIVDDSSSMSLPAGPYRVEHMNALAVAVGLVEADATGKPPPLNDEQRKQLAAMTRAELLDRALARFKAKQGEELRKRYDIRTYLVARDVRRVPENQGGAVASGSARNGSDSSLGEAIESVVNEAAGRPIAGVVLLSDGRWTRGTPPMTVARRLAEGSADSAATIFTVPIGSSDPAADLAVLDVFAPAEVAKGDSPAILATIGSQGFDGQEVEVVLREGETVLDTQKLTLASGPRQQVQLTFAADEPGSRVLTVAVAPRPEERVQDNNEQAVAVRVGTEKLRLLLVEGTPRWDFRFLDHALRRDHGLEVKLVMESQLVAGGIKPEELPTVAGLPTGVEGFGEYHVVMLGDVSPAMLPPGVQAGLAAAVEEKGLGLIVQAGTQHMPHDHLDAPLGKLLPVRVTSGGIEAPAFQPLRMVVTPAGATHPAFALYPDASRNRQAWSQMPTFFWAAGATELTPGATLLAEVETESGRRPLIAEQFVGRGRVLMVGLDETFRWRRNVGDALFYRFWGQAIRHVARKRQRDGNENWVEVQPADSEPGSPIAVELFAVHPSGQPLNESRVAVTLGDGKESQTLVLDRSTPPGHYRGTWTPQTPGLVTVTYTDPAGKGVSATARIADSGRERRHPTVDRDLLAGLAHATGGRMIEPSDLATLPKLLTGNPVTLDRVHESEIWDNWLVLALLVGLYCTDVGIRRVLGLA